MQKQSSLVDTGKVWTAVGAIGLSIAWLLPNHSLPWTSFHSEAWAAFVLLMVGACIVYRSERQPNWNVFTILVLLISVIPLAQFAFGKINFFGTAWLNTVYLLGFWLSIRVGELWEKNSPNRASDLIFGAVFLASLLSVGIQLYQLIGRSALDIWTLNFNDSSRFYGNLAQPNQLASLLILGLIAISWAHFRGVLSASVGVAFACALLFGVALTESRTALLNICLLTASVIAYRKYLTSWRYIAVLIGLWVLYVVFILSIPSVIAYVRGGEEDSVKQTVRGLSDPIRLKAWSMLIYASSKEAITGYGWGQLAAANYAVVGEFPGQPGLFLHSHNLLLDLVLWNGYVVGVAMILLVIAWMWRCYTAPKALLHLHPIAAISVLAVHGMLEYPLHYAYFLLPVGIFVGVLQNRMKIFRLPGNDRMVNIALVVIVLFAFVATVKDYFRVERSFYGLRFELQNIPTNISKDPPRVLVLTQFPEYFKLARGIPTSGLNESNIQALKNTVMAMPGDLLVYKLAANLALNGKPEEAGRWLINLCKTRETNCQRMRNYWEAETEPGIKSVPWPEEFR